MTIERQDHRVVYNITTADTQYPFDFPADSADDVMVYDLDPDFPEYAEEYRTPLPDAHVIPAPTGIRDGGIVTLITVPAIGHELEIIRVTPRMQQRGYQAQMRIDPKSIEYALDLLTMMIQESVGRDALLAVYSEIYRLEEMVEAKADKAELESVRQALMALITSLQNDKEDKTKVEAIRAALQAAIDDLQASKVDKTVFDVEVDRIDADLATRATKDELAEGLEAKADLNHAARHAAGGADAITPESINALHENHIDRLTHPDPHQQYWKKDDRLPDPFFMYQASTLSMALVAETDAVESIFHVYDAIAESVGFKDDIELPAI